MVSQAQFEKIQGYCSSASPRDQSSSAAAPAETMLLTDQCWLHRAEPKTLRHRLPHTAARITRGQRKVFRRLAEHWPGTLALPRAFARLRQMPLSD